MKRSLHPDSNEATTAVDRLLARVSSLPNFPFDDWHSDQASFAAVTAFWRDLFESAAGEKANDYRDCGTIEMDENSYTFHVQSMDYTRQIRACSYPSDGDICVIWQDATDYYRPDLVHLGERPDRVELALTSDMDRDRLIAVFEAIREFTIAAISSWEAADALEKQFHDRWRDVLYFAERFTAQNWASSPESDYDHDKYDAPEGFARMAEIAHDFDFGPHLPKATFPTAFVDAYAALGTDDPIDWDADRTHFVARFGASPEVVMYNGIFSPATIQSQNAIISNPLGNDPAAPRLPPLHYVVGDAISDTDEFRLLINLDPDAANYGHLFLWRFTSERPMSDLDHYALAPLAARLEDFWPLLMTKAQAHAVALGSPHDLIASPKLANAVSHAAAVFADYLGRPTGDHAFDVRASLPAIFGSIAANDPVVLERLETALGQLGTVGWRSNWNRDEVFAVEYFGKSLFEDCLHSDGLFAFAQGIRTALPLKRYLALLLGGGFDLDALNERWIEMLAFDDVGAIRHAASLRFDVRRDTDGAFVDIGLVTMRHRAALGRLAGCLITETEWAIGRRRGHTIDATERALIDQTLALNIRGE